MLRKFINSTKGSVAVSDESNINRNDIARKFHYNDFKPYQNSARKDHIAEKNGRLLHIT